MVAQILCATIRSCYPLFMFSSQLARLQALCYRFSYNIIAKITMHLQCLLLNKNYHRCFPTLSLPASSVKMLKLGELLNIPSFTNKNEGSGNEYNKKPILVTRRPLTVRMRPLFNPPECDEYPNNQKFKN